MIHMKVAIIGCGVGGLCSLHRMVEAFPNAVVHGFEASDSIGGTWAYSEDVKLDGNIPLMNGVYKNLRTNLPKCIMQFPDFPINEECTDFLSKDEYLGYLKDYCLFYDLNKYIKFRHYVTNVKKIEEGWEVQYRDLREDVEKSDRYDYVIVCNGHYTHSFIPQYKGLDIFKGGVIHSHLYRIPEDYKDKVVLIIGAGPSGQEISYDLSKESKKLYFSHHRSRLLESYPSHFITKPDVEEFSEKSVIFVDGTAEVIDEIIFCTGYSYHCSFLDENAGIISHGTHLSGLYKEIVNIEHPSMMFVGVPHQCCLVPLMDMQARYIVAAVKGSFQLPSKQLMVDHNIKRQCERKKFGIKEEHMHHFGTYEDEYFESLKVESGIQRVPKVYCKIRESVAEIRDKILQYNQTFRNYKYTVLDENTFHWEYVHPNK